ncbi:hypothetical protein PEL8287_01477 [Roseovarius litorisediminis]|uniref:Uncharacterized protein n=1 Tax=Roseovarius litorisediminis TaxID=1312363 RepID=A0A1Y5S2W9_9RHOB|nr:hypothetical protein PEL8287_01477 [Roseovarius litorisediminis]
MSGVFCPGEGVRFEGLALCRAIFFVARIARQAFDVDQSGRIAILAVSQSVTGSEVATTESRKTASAKRPAFC